MLLYKKIYEIDQKGHQRALKQMQPIFDYTSPPMFGNKKQELIKMAQENLYMLKRITEKTSFYNVNKWNKDYETSQIYKKSLCQFPSIDFYKTQRASSFYKTYTTSLSESSNGNYFNRNKFRTMNQTTNSFRNIKKKKKKFSDFTYHDLIDNDENGGLKDYYESKKLATKKKEKEEQKKSQNKNEENNNENESDEQIGFKTLNNIDDVEEDKNNNENNVEEDKNNNENNDEEVKNNNENDAEEVKSNNENNVEEVKNNNENNVEEVKNNNENNVDKEKDNNENIADKEKDNIVSSEGGRNISEDIEDKDGINK